MSSTTSSDDLPEQKEDLISFNGQASIEESPIRNPPVKGFVGDKNKKRINAEAFCSHLLRRYNESNILDGPLSRENSFQNRLDKSMLRARSELMPINLSRKDLSDRSLACKNNLTDIEPMKLDTSIGFDQVAGHEEKIRALKESVILPLVYPELFWKFGIEPPRGVLFCGPPGTGKTLLARSLANECNKLLSAKVDLNQQSLSNAMGSKQIAFFMRKGADCLSKWLGESERQLRLLFDQAYRLRPSIIFFDEIDGLAPVRSSKNDQIHASIVSTLLSLMDGMENRGEVIVIGATNRPDCIDPALRRPGRFDREFTFNLPDEKVRNEILRIHTSKWDTKPSEEMFQEISGSTVGYCGADLKALTSEAFFCCLRRLYPQVYSSDVKLALNPYYLQVTQTDWEDAMKIVRPSALRSKLDAASVFDLSSMGTSSTVQALTVRSPLHHDLVKPVLESLSQRVDRLLFSHELPDVHDPTFTLVHSCSNPGSISQMLLYGDVPNQLMHALWHHFEAVPVYTVAQSVLTSLPKSMSICPNSALLQIISAAKSTILGGSCRAAIIYLPALDVTLERMSSEDQQLIIDSLQALAQEDQEDLLPVKFRTHPPKLLVIATVKEVLTAKNWPESMRTKEKRSHNSSPSHCNGNSAHSYSSQKTVADKLLEEVFTPKRCEVIMVPPPRAESVQDLFKPLIMEEIFRPINENKTKTSQQAPTPQPVLLDLENERMASFTGSGPGSVVEKKLNQEELEALEFEEEQVLRQFRAILRRVVNRLYRERRFQVFSRAVTPEEAPDYEEVIKQPMHLSLMRDKIDAHQYTTIESFVKDFELIYLNALEYNPDRVARSREIRARAADFWDTACLCMFEEIEDQGNIIMSTVQVQEAKKKRTENANNDEDGLSPNKAQNLPMPMGSRFSKRLHGGEATFVQLPPKRATRIEKPVEISIEPSPENQVVTPEQEVEKEVLGPSQKELENFMQELKKTCNQWEFDSINRLYNDLEHIIKNVWWLRWDRREIVPEMQNILRLSANYL
ncbi:ATPase AAA domain-containing protein 2B [Cichlidogyrus casuarinus]|uniref:ATPase AAA domain-containing protein 2B n=1 Tax=Cichlidogyrus casuarinus TaxID=1844966 RepID=A0ABD2QJ07_9PLAT